MTYRLLALDASSSACSAAVLVRDQADDHCLARFELTPRAHTRRLLPMVDEVLAESGLLPGDLDAVAFGQGPGAFTGLRIAAGAAQGLAYGLDRPLIGVSTLAALALQSHRRFHCRHVVTALDARMGELYAAIWHCQDDRLARRGEEVVIAPGQLQVPDDSLDWVGVGSGMQWREAFSVTLQGAVHQYLDTLEPRAEEMAWLAMEEWVAGRIAPLHSVQPVYLRNDVAWKK